MASEFIEKPKKVARPATKAVPPMADPAPAAVEALPVEALPVEAIETVAVIADAIPEIEDVKIEATAAEAVNQGTKKMNEAINQTQDTIKNAAAETEQKATEMFNEMNARAKTAMEKAGSLAKDTVEFHKGNLEALVEAGKIAAKGTQAVAQNAADYGRRNFEATTAMVKEAAALRSPTELLKLQGEFVRGQFDSAVAEMSRSTEFGLKLAGEIFQPIQNRYAVVAEEMKTRLAA